MQPCKLYITCDDFAAGEHPWYHQGQLIRGTVHVQVMRRMSATLRIDQILHFDEGHQVIHSAVLGKGIWEHGYHRLPFTCTTDDGPQTSDDAWWSLAVMVADVRTDFSGMIDRFFAPIPGASMGYTKMMPGARPPVPGGEHRESESEQTAKTAIFLVYGAILTLFVAIFGIRQLDFEASPVLKIVAISAVVAFMLAGALALTLTYLKSRTRRRRGVSSAGFPQTLPKPTAAIFPDDDADRRRPSEGASDATGQ